MKKFKVLTRALALTMVFATIIGCQKQKGSDTYINQNYKKPIAMFDNSSGLITTFIDANAINEKVGEESVVIKDDANRFVLESVEIIDSVPRNKDVAGEIKLTLLDTEEECSYTIWCMKNFVVKDVKEQQVNYYLEDNVANSSFNVAFKVQDICYIADFVGDSLSLHEVDNMDYGINPWVLFWCRSVDCTNQCDKAGTFFHAYCKPCPFHDGQCNEDSALPTIIGIVILGSQILKFFI